MKVVGKLQVLYQTDRFLAIDPEIAANSGLGPDATLDAVVLLRAQEAALPAPRATLIATTLPKSSWGRLVRTSVTLDPQPGALGTLLEALNRIRLRCRYVETINDVDLQGRSLLGLDRSRRLLVQPERNAADPHEVRLSNLIIPSTLLILEIPAEKDGLNGLGEDEKRLHLLLRDVAATEPGQSQNKASGVSSLQAVLREKLKEIAEEKAKEASGKNTERTGAHLVAVDWISPMSTLNVLSRRTGEEGRSSHTLLVSDDGEGQSRLDLGPLREVLWDPSPVAQLINTMDPRPSVFVKGFVDSDEKVLCWDFYQFEDDLVVQFELKTPTGGREHLWWRWIYECLECAGGNVLASVNSARTEGGWATLVTTAVFSLNEKAKPGQSGYIGAIIDCFRKLQGSEGHTQHFDDLKTDLAKIQDESLDLLNKTGEEIGRDPRYRSVLQKVEVWDPAIYAMHPTHQYVGRFAQNPFNFTSPLDLERYQLLYGEGSDKPGTMASPPLAEDLQRTRRRLAMRIIEKLASDPGENIAIVGAHRAGKTTVLNLVFDILDKGAYDAEGKVLTPVRINAALEPPHLFFSAIKRELEARKNGKWEELRKAAEDFSLALGPIISAFEVGLEVITGMPIAFSLGGLRGLLKRKTPQSLDGSQQFSAIMILLRDHLEKLRDALKKVEKKQMKLVIIVDEFSESSRWGHAQALPLWRHVIEAQGFSSLKWLISTSRPIKDTSDYSPITNALHEFNVGSLPHDESDLLIDAFSVLHWKRKKLLRGDTGGDGKNLRPVVMFQARRFLQEVTSRLAYLMQVVCYHVYDRATRTYVPLVSRSLCIEIICDHVLPELSDYFEHQWSPIREDVQQTVKGSLNRFKDQKDFLKNLSAWEDDFHQLPQGTRKALERSGLRGDDSHCVAPLVACWLLAPSRD